MVAEEKLTGKIPCGTAFRALEIAYKTAPVLILLMFRIFAYTLSAVTADNTVLTVIFIYYIAGTVVEIFDTLPAVFNVKSGFNIPYSFIMQGRADLKPGISVQKPPVFF